MGLAIVFWNCGGDLVKAVEKEKAAIQRIAAHIFVVSDDQKDAVIEPTTPALLMLRPLGEKSDLSVST